MNDKIIVRSIVDADVCGNGGGYFINLKKTQTCINLIINVIFKL